MPAMPSRCPTASVSSLIVHRLAPGGGWLQATAATSALGLIGAVLLRRSRTPGVPQRILQPLFSVGQKGAPDDLPTDIKHRANLFIGQLVAWRRQNMGTVNLPR